MPITLSVFVQLLGEGISISTLPLYMRGMGASAPTIGVATSCFSLMQMVCCPLFVRASSKIGRRKMLRMCLAGATFAQMLIALSPSIWGILLGRALGGAFSASVPVAQAGVTDLVKPSQSALALSRVSASSQMGIVVGPLFSAGAAAMFSYLGVPNHLLVRCVFATSAAFACGVLALSPSTEDSPATPTPTSSLAPSPAAPPAASPPAASEGAAATVASWYDAGVRIGSIATRSKAASVAGAAVERSVATWNQLPGASLVRDGGLSQLMLRAVAGTVGWSLTLCVGTYCLFANAFLGYSQPQLSATFSSGAAITVLTQLLIFPRLIKAVGEHLACAMGLTLLSVSLSSIPLMQMQPFHLGMYLAARVGAGVADTSTATLVARTSKDSKARASNLAFITSTRAGVRIVSPILSGFLFERSRTAAFAPGALPYLIVAGILAVLVPVPLVLKRFEDNQKDTQQ